MSTEQPTDTPPQRALSDAALIGGALAAVVLCMGLAAIIILLGIAARRGADEPPTQPVEAPAGGSSPTPTSQGRQTPTPDADSARPTGTPGPSPTAPRLAIPPLSCVFDTSVGNCYDYCQDPANEAECDAARAHIESQGADPDAFFECMRTDLVDPLTCMREAWYANR